jgi:hypothetical protein
MSRWLVVGEGPSEIGTSADRERFLELLIRVLAEDADPALVRALGCGKWDAVVLPELIYEKVGALKEARVPPPQPQGPALVAARASRAADIRQCDAVVVLLDNDHFERKKGRTKRDLIAEQLGKGPLPYAAGVSKETLEAWIIADPEVLPVTVTISKQPEDVWGAPRDSKGEHPKQVLRRALDAARVDYRDVLDGWCLARAARRAPNLRVFCAAIVRLMRDPSLCERRP